MEEDKLELKVIDAFKKKAKKKYLKVYVDKEQVKLYLKGQTDKICAYSFYLGHDEPQEYYCITKKELENESK